MFYLNLNVLYVLNGFFLASGGVCVHCVDRGNRVGSAGYHGPLWQGFRVYGKVQCNPFIFFPTLYFWCIFEMND